MSRIISIGKQDFVSLRKNHYFYIDKTDLICKWWESKDEITLITRPRRFGKTLNMSMLNCFFSNQFTGREDLFKGLAVWKKEKYRKMQGTYPVIFLSFAAIKGSNYEDARDGIIMAINEAYSEHRYLLESNELTDGERKCFEELDYYAKNPGIKKQVANDTICNAVKNLANCLSRYYKKKVIILLDEYDTPMQEAYLYGYWKEFTAFIRSLFNATFKTNPYLERAMMTGITRVSKESVFSDLNNLVVVTTTSNQYETAFGFTEEEVFNSLDEQGLSDKKDIVKTWYDGFTFGDKKDIYNPWSIINLLKFKTFKTYWADSSSNGLINSLVKTGSSYIKTMMEMLLKGETIAVPIDEQIVFSELDYSEDAVWSLMLASGYLKVVSSEELNLIRESDNEYELALTNREILFMFRKMILRWFSPAKHETNEFIRALISGDIESMNEYMNDVALNTFSSFDSGKHNSERKAPENFFHGFVLGLMVDQSENYIITSNRESGYGRYDIMLEPIDKTNEKYPGIVIEFKVINPRKENTLEETVEAALKQIEEKNYDAELIGRGVNPSNIHHYGFAFKGKEVLIDGTRKDAS